MRAGCFFGACSFPVPRVSQRQGVQGVVWFCRCESAAVGGFERQATFEIHQFSRFVKEATPCFETSDPSTFTSVRFSSSSN